MESRTLNLALCYFGSIDKKDDVLEKAKQKFPEYNIHLFSSIGNNKYLELWRVSLLKRNYELEHNFEFDVCIGLNSEKFRSFNYTRIDEVEPNTVYYISGYHQMLTHLSGANFSIFFSKSIEFDRVAEFFHSRQFINTGLNDESQQFLYHIKTLGFEAECINFENSSLFIRTT